MTLRGEKLVPLATVARLLCCSQATLRRNATSWELVPIWRGRSPLFRVSQVKAWLDRGGSRSRRRVAALRYRKAAA
jgi:hypothetical protein